MNCGHSEKQSSQNAMVCEQGAFWKTVFPKCHGLWTGSILENSLPKMPWFMNREHSGKQSSQNAMVCEQGASWKTVFPKCHDLWTLHWISKCLRPLGSFGGPRTASLPESLEKRWSFGPKLLRSNDQLKLRPKPDAAVHCLTPLFRVQFFLRLNYLDMHRTYGCSSNPGRARPLCRLCGKKFCQPQKLKLHMKRVHPGAGAGAAAFSSSGGE